jgi:hypothetical protein
MLAQRSLRFTRLTHRRPATRSRPRSPASLAYIIGFGQILGRGTDAGVLAGVFGFAVIVFGSLIGAGFALSGREATRG